MIPTVSSVLFVVSGWLSYAAGKGPCMCVAKLSFSLNIISFFWSIAVFSVTVFQLQYLSILDSHHETLFKGVIGLMMSLLVFENSVAAFLIYWMSKAICREDFNTLPIILLKQRD
ncbi:putative membrane-spanning 4-domains subfamily A member 4A isoform 2 [Scophthalmus maximus]|nr:putative membrane-spanning 4-domains subfamily A member 4A isoform 2 [Scophthalmus maximus]